MIKRILRSVTKWLWRRELIERERAIASLNKIEEIAKREHGALLYELTQAVYDKHCEIWAYVRDICEQEIKSIYTK